MTQATTCDTVVLRYNINQRSHAMTELECKISDLLSTAMRTPATPNEIAIEVTQFLNEEYDRQLEEAFGIINGDYND